MSQADAVAEVRENPAKRDPVLDYMDRALAEIHEAVMEHGCYPVPQPGRPCRVEVSIAAFYDACMTYRDLDDDFEAMWASSHTVDGWMAIDAIKSRRAEMVRDWLRGRSVVQNLAADMAREEEDES